jgi:MraZ protein
MKSLIGQYEVKLTEKGRLALPVGYRKIVGNKAFIARWYEGCLVIVSSGSWDALLERVTAKSAHLTQAVRDTDRFILGSAFEIELDEQGRFVVPKLLREYAQLSGNVTFLGLGDRIEIWDSNAWNKREKIIYDSASALLERIAEHDTEI